MMHAGLDLSRKKIDVCLLSDEGELCGELAVPADADGLRGHAYIREAVSQQLRTGRPTDFRSCGGPEGTVGICGIRFPPSR